MLSGLVFPSIFSWHSLNSSLLIKCPMDVKTMSGFSLDNCDIPSGGFHRFPWYYPAVRLPHPVCPPPLRLYGIQAVPSAGECWLSYVGALFLYSMIGCSPTPQQHPESRHIDKLVFCLPLT